MSHGDLAAVNYESLRDGHERIARLSADLHVWWGRCRASTTVPFEQLVQRLLSLKDLVRAHFQLEEQAARQDSSQQPVSLSQDRAVLQADFEQLILRLRACQPGMECWVDAALAVDRFLEKLQAHELRELELLSTRISAPSR